MQSHLLKIPIKFRAILMKNERDEIVALKYTAQERKIGFR